MQQKWWEINPKTLADTPFLALYSDRISQNIKQLIAAVNGDVSKLRPHVKTHKLGDILELFKVYGINKVKCATVSEAELCAMHGIKNILLAYQPVGQVKQNRWLTLIQKYPEISFSTIVDNLEVTNELSKLGQSKNEIFSIYLDINTGMNRTGVEYKSNWEDLLFKINELPNIQHLGLHIYDGHLHGTENERTHFASEAFSLIKEKLHTVEQQLNAKMKIVAGGSGTFPFYATAENVECSPGTFVFWDINYQINLPEQNFLAALLVVGTVVSKPTENTLCIDIGYKAVASENSLDKRLVILNDTNLVPVSQSEEHLVVENKGNQQYRLGDIIYAIPYHVCPTCALHDTVYVVNSQQAIQEQWTVLARKRKITI